MGKSRVGKTALAFFVVSFVLSLLAFFTPSWLVTDGELTNPKFEKIGLWYVCFRNFEDIRHWYDTMFTGCWWVYEEEYQIIHEFLLPNFFIATELFYSISFLLTISAAVLLALYLISSKDTEYFVCLLVSLGTLVTLAAVFGAVAVVLFGANGDRRYWMPHWEHNNMGWSFVAAVIGVCCSFASGVLLLVESRVHRINHKRLERNGRGVYDMDDRTTYYG